MTHCHLSFVCGKKWDDLAATPEASARYCNDCGKNVFKIKTEAQLSVATALRRCVAIADDNDFISAIGESTFEWLEPGYLHDVLVGTAHPLSAPRADLLRRFFPMIFDAGPNERTLNDGGLVKIENVGPAAREILLCELASLAPELNVATKEV
ncbi:hypothetical protein V8J88_21435 [Massilia sp. W12]|uniref:hypothetical protein n=1 Tax=Massilia sp. W12 TaxID=3126507 RepID=UPI0030D327A8